MIRHVCAHYTQSICVCLGCYQTANDQHVFMQHWPAQPVHSNKPTLPPCQSFSSCYVLAEQLNALTTRRFSHTNIDTPNTLAIQPHIELFSPLLTKMLVGAKKKNDHPSERHRAWERNEADAALMA